MFLNLYAVRFFSLYISGKGLISIQGKSMFWEDLIHGGELFGFGKNPKLSRI